MLRLKYVFFIMLFAVLVSGCGQRVVETLHVPLEPGPYAPGAGSTVVILPFADYTYSDDLASAYRRNLKISESLTDHLSAEGFMMPVAEDVFGYLVDQKVIQIADYQRNNNVSLTNELSGDWSEPMMESIRHYLGQQMVTQKRRVQESPGVHALDQKEIAKLGRAFKADYVVRGRILEYRTRQDPTWEPWRKGFFPVISGGSARILYGFAGSDSYDTMDHMMAAGIVGIGIGSATSWPVDRDIAIDGTLKGNEIAWGAIGGVLGGQAARSGRVDQAVVQLRMWVQDATTGQVVWTNRAMVRVSPESVFADGQWDDLFNTAIEKGVSSLVENFVTVGL